MQDNALGHYDGTQWTWTDTAARMRAVWANASNDVWAGGDGGVLLHYDGGGWSSVASGTTASIADLSGYSANDIWAAAGSVVLHWNGQSWTFSPLPANSGSAHAIWSVASDNVWAFGGQPVGSEGTPPVAWHYDGSTWTTVAVPAPKVPCCTSPGALVAAWGSSASDIWAVGNGSALHYDGTTWKQLDNLTLYTTGPAAVWSDGSETFMQARTTSTAAAGGYLQFDGNNWKATASWNFDGLYGDASLMPANAWGSGANDVWAVNSHQIIHYNGSRWVTAPPPANASSFTSITGSAANDVRLAGTAVSWITSTARPGRRFPWARRPDIWHVFSVSQSLAYAITSDTLYRWNGFNWSQAAQVASASMQSIWATGTDAFATSGPNIYAFDQNGFKGRSIRIPTPASSWKTSGAPRRMTSGR